MFVPSSYFLQIHLTSFQMNILMLGQDHLEEVLRASLAVYGVYAELDTELVAISQDKDRATATIVKHSGTDREHREVITYPFVVGTDGARGVCRKLLGMTFLGETRNVENLIIGDIMVDGLESNVSSSTCRSRI